MAGFRIGVIPGDRRHKLRFIKLDARLAKHLVDRLNGFRRHHGGGAHFIHLQDRRRVAGTEGGDTGAQALFIVALVYRNDFVIRIGRVKALRQRIHFFTQFAFH